jgi:DNA-binding transcriptional LysR family regulator
MINWPATRRPTQSSPSRAGQRRPRPATARPSSLGKPLKLRIQLSSFDAMCRMIGAGVGVGIVPESTARRNQARMGIALIELTDAWSVRERFILVRNRDALPRYAESLIETLIDHYRKP